MFKVLFFLFLVVPIVEISILIQLAEVIGGWTTILLVILTAYLGARMVKLQGLQTIEQIRQKSATGQIPGEELFSGVCILISGVLLLTPGILTDILGFALLSPMIRRQMIQALKHKIHLFTPTGNHQAFTFTSTEYQRQDFSSPETVTHEDEVESVQRDRATRDHTHTRGSNQVIDGEFERKD